MLRTVLFGGIGFVFKTLFFGVKVAFTIAKFMIAITLLILTVGKIGSSIMA